MVNDLVKHFELKVFVFNTDEGPCMAHCNLGIPDGNLNFFRQFQQSHIIGDRRPVFPYPSAKFFLVEFTFFREAFIAERNFYGVEVLAVYVFYRSEERRVRKECRSKW